MCDASSIPIQQIIFVASVYGMILAMLGVVTGLKVAPYFQERKYQKRMNKEGRRRRWVNDWLRFHPDASRADVPKEGTY
jgi:hypothetical protein